MAAAEQNDFAAGRAAERADLLVYLEQKAASAQQTERKRPDHADHWRQIARQFEVLRDDVAAGLHESGAA